jgi:hypothetical protein
MKGEAKVTLLEGCCISLPCDTALWTRIVFTWVFFFYFMFHFVCDEWQNQALCVCIKFCVKLSKSATRTLEMLCEKSRQRFLIDIHISRLFVYQMKTRIFKETMHQQNDRRCWKNLRSHLWRLSPKIHKLTDTAGISCGIWQEILTENLNMCRIAAKFVPWLWQMIKSSSA